MPWFPDFVNAAQLARRETHTAGQADPVGQYLTALQGGDADPVETAWPGDVVVLDPRAGEVRGHRPLQQFVRRNQAWLAEHDAHIETLAAIRVGTRAVVELVARVVVEGRETTWPVAVVAESVDERSVVFRTYCSQVPVDGRRHVRPPILEAGGAAPRLDDVVDHYVAALEAGDIMALTGMFASQGYLREPIGANATHRGAAELRSYFARCFSAGGGIGLQQCARTDDGTDCAVEYNVVRWGSHDLAPQAGLGVFERSPDGLLAAVRVYDDVEAPLLHG